MSYIKTNQLNITHEDQEVDGLKFCVLTSKDGFSYVQVDGPIDAITNWQARVVGIDSSIDEINAVIAALPKTEQQIMVNRLESVEIALASMLGQ